MTDFQGVVKAWDEDGRTGGHRIHPLAPDSDEFWALGRTQADQVRSYARAGSSVVDFGCGIGRLAIPLMLMGYQVTAVDASQAMLDQLAERVEQATADPRSPKAIDLVLSDGIDLPDRLGEGNADVVISRAVLIHHDYEAAEALVCAMGLLLKEGGHLIADWPTSHTPRERRDWIDVTTWHPHHRRVVAHVAGLEPVITDTEPSVWRKAEQPYEVP